MPRRLSDSMLGHQAFAPFNATLDNMLGFASAPPPASDQPSQASGLDNLAAVANIRSISASQLPGLLQDGSSYPAHPASNTAHMPSSDKRGRSASNSSDSHKLANYKEKNRCDLPWHMRHDVRRAVVFCSAT